MAAKVFVVWYTKSESVRGIFWENNIIVWFVTPQLKLFEYQIVRFSASIENVCV
jgi:hypothetical protein